MAYTYRSAIPVSLVVCAIYLIIDQLIAQLIIAMQKSTLKAPETRANVLHSSASNEHYTPTLIAQKSRNILGGIELDPCSCKLANEIIRAEQYYSLEEGIDGLQQSWKSRSLLLNPRGGQIRDREFIKRYGTSSSIAAWGNELKRRWEVGEVQQAIFIGFQLSVLRLCPGFLSLPFCVPRERLCFWTTPHALRQAEAAKRKPDLQFVERWILECIDKGECIDSEHGFLVPSHSPSHDNVIIFFPPKKDGREEALANFAAEFADVGEIANLRFWR